jgi:transposase-like protein
LGDERKKAAYPAVIEKLSSPTWGQKGTPPMRQTTTNDAGNPAIGTTSKERSTIGFSESENRRSPLDALVREGARKMLQAALEGEVQEFLEEHSSRVDEQGRRQVVRNGYLPPREIVTGAGPLEISQPRVRDKSAAASERVRFSSSILPPYLRKSKSMKELIPWLYLKGISTGDFSEALQSLIGPNVSGFSANVVVRLKEQWGQEYDTWSKRDLAGKHYVYIWADGIYANIRLEDEANSRQCLLVLMGATAEGEKELIAVIDGYRESKQSWMELLLDLKHRGLTIDPKLAIGDGALGFWAAIREVYPKAREQRCWVHKTANVLNKMPKSVQPKAKADIHEIWQAETRQMGNKAFDHFLEKYGAKYPDACECLKKDREALLTFYDFPAEHWGHLRTTNPIESTFATIRLRHRRTKGNGTRRASLTMMFKLAQAAQSKWRRLNGHQLITLLIQGRIFIDGILQLAA